MIVHSLSVWERLKKVYNVHLIGGGDGVWGDSWLLFLTTDSNPDSISSPRTPEMKQSRRRIDLDCEPTITGKKTLRTLHSIKETTNPIKDYHLIFCSKLCLLSLFRG